MKKKKAKATATEAAQEAAPAVDQTPEAPEATPAAPEAPEAPAEDAQATVAALQASVEALQAQLQEMRDREEAREREAKRAQRLEKAGIPASLGAFIRDDADLEALNETLAVLAKSSPAPAGVASTPTLPTVGTKNPGGEVLSVDEMLVRAEANNDTNAVSRLKLAKLASVSNLI